MGQFKPMVKMMTTEPTVELKLKKGGSVSKAMGGMMGAPMDASMASSAPARGGMMPVARPKRPTMAARRAAMLGMKGMQGGMKEGGESKMKGLEKELKSHESKPASKGHKGLATGGIAKSTKPGGYATGGVVNGQGGYKKGGAIASVIPESVSAKGGEGYKNTKMVTAHPDNNSAPTGDVKLGNGGGYKKGGATKKHYATGGAVNNSGHAVAMPQGAKKPSAPVSINRLSGTFKAGGKVMLKDGGQGAITDRERKAMENLSKGQGSVTDKEKSVKVDPEGKKRGGRAC